MKRRVFTILSALSLMLSLATCALGVRSHWVEDEFEFVLGDISFARGEILAGLCESHLRHSTQAPSDLVGEIRSANHWGNHGFYFISEDGRGKYEPVDAVAFPWWFAFLIFLMPPLLWLLPRRQDKRDRAPRCRTCGYDLRASPERCPECGTIVENRTERALTTDGYG